MLRPFRWSALFLLSALVVPAALARAQVCVPPAFKHLADITGGAHGGFDRIHQMALSPDGRVYVVDGYKHRIRVYEATGGYLGSFGTQGSGPGQLDVPAGAVFDHDGNLYVAEQFNHRIQKFSPTHVPMGSFGSQGSGPGQLSYPTNLAISPDGTRLYVAELLNHRVSMFDRSGGFLGSFGSFGSGPGQLDLPFGIVVDSAGDVYVNGGKNHNVVRYDADGNYLSSFGSFGTAPGEFNHSVGLGIDADEHLYVTDQLNNRVQKLTRDGTPLEVFGAGMMYNPWVVLPLPGGEVWVGDTFNYRIRVYGESTSSPRILSIVDVADDEGHQVRIRFLASDRDRAGVGNPVLQYEAYRKIAGTEVATPAQSPTARSAHAEAGAPRRLDLAGWEFVGAVPAHAETEYNMVAPTLQDSKSNHLHYATFFVRAATAVPAVYDDACPDSGLSYDKKAPPVPGNFHVAGWSSGGVELEWNASEAADLDHYAVYRGTVPGFTPSAETRIAEVGETAFTDMAAPQGAVHYLLSAVDDDDNESAHAQTSTDIALDAADAGQPLAFAVHPIEPNPSTAWVAVRFDLPVDTPVSVRVFDVRGRLVRALAARVPTAAGRHRLAWDGRTTSGARAAAGLYYFQFDAGPFAGTRRVVLAR